MPRIPRIVIPQTPHHVTQRGVRKSVIFECDEDKRVYLLLLKKFSDKHGLKILAYCLMSNHIHLIAVPIETVSLAKTIRDAHSKYASYFNAKNDVTGHLFQYRFFSCPMDNQHTLNAVRYVERNPVEAGLVKKADEYPWSSAAAHTQDIDNPILDSDLTRNLHLQISKKEWLKWLNRNKQVETILLCKHISAGIPLGGREFLTRIKKQYGARTELNKRGRPCKKQR